MAGVIPIWKIVEQQLGTMMDGKQTRERMTRKSEYQQLAATKNKLAS
jgi:hypothetical protein